MIVLNSVLPLLKAVATDANNIDISNVDDKTIEFILNSGLSGYFNSYVNKSHLSKNNLQCLYSAEITTKFIAHTQISALSDLLSNLSDSCDEVYLLKGMHMSLIYYPRYHYRIMGDIDILVPYNNINHVKSVLLELGYVQKSENSEDYYETHHHLMPFYNEDKNVWIEVHTGLFSKKSMFEIENAFSLENIRKNYKNCVNDEYGIKARMLSPELHLIYSCIHWIDDLKIYKTPLQLIDMILLIKYINANNSWDKFIKVIDLFDTRHHVGYVLEYFNKNKIIDVPDYVLSKLNNDVLGLVNKYLLNKVTSHYLLGKTVPGKLLNNDIIEIIWNTLWTKNNQLVNLLNIPLNVIFPANEKSRYDLKILYQRILKYIS